MKVVGIIPARFASTRFGGKPLARILDKTLIRTVYEQAASSKLLNDLIVATDDQRIAAEVESFKGKVVLSSPEHRCGTERVAQAAAGIDADIVVNIQGDELLSSGGMVDECVGPLLRDESFYAATLACQIADEADFNNPNVTKVVINLRGTALYFSRSPIPSATFTAGSRGTSFLRHIGTYAFRKDFLFEFVRLEQTPLELAESLEQLRILEHGRELAVTVTRSSSFGVDVPSDIRGAERFLLALRAPALEDS
ncbi:MAG: 3-deoxy-manno-octulosonate cytidylyltransferase [Candidatus Eisenbacteria bacterium]